MHKFGLLNLIAPILLAATATLSTPILAEGSHIFIQFTEGYYQDDAGQEGSKYSAHVSVWQCEPFKKLGYFRGSTLPNPYWVYKDSNGKPFDIDGQLHDVFNNLDKSDLDSLGLGGLRP